MEAGRSEIKLATYLVFSEGLFPDSYMVTSLLLYNRNGKGISRIFFVLEACFYKGFVFMTQSLSQSQAS